MKIAVLCGGYSHERDVSLSTGTGAAHALRERGHRVALVDVFLGVEQLPEDIDTLFTVEDKDQRRSVSEREPDLEELRRLRPGKRLVGPGVLEICEHADMAFLALHGGNGENGQLQATLDMYGIPYTGSGYIGSALAMDKELTKSLLLQSGIGTARGRVFRRGEKCDIPLPCVVKPCSGGSSVGTAIVREEKELEDALEAAFACEERVLVEQYISGRELTVGILDGRAMSVIEIIPHNGFYDYKNKYQAGFTEELCPAPLTPRETEKVQRAAEAVFRTLHLQVYARADFILDASGALFCLEANTLPGMTPTSLIPQMAAAEGMSYGELCEEILRCSKEKYE
ncbi:MAG: D-alanine--D-alanine ligase [Oscillospiraceae bacterium]|nr:D-alanine--D-alanine ligase [Oscillospiraceae bacterium]